MELNEYQVGALETWNGTNRLERSILGLCGEAGEVAEARKKYLRGDYGEDEYIYNTTKEIGDTLYYLSMYAYELGINLDDIATTNYNKLRSRKERNVIKGSGDNR